MELIRKYFPGLSAAQYEMLGRLMELYTEWNGRINVISRKDLDHLYLRHVLHSLAIARVCAFDDGARIADVGCGGGFPSIPLAIMFPGARFSAIDSIGKKIKVVEAVAGSLGLKNITPVNARIESVDGTFDYVVSRAVTDMSSFIGWTWNKIGPGQAGSLPNGILYLKGGDLDEELTQTGRRFDLYNVQDFFPEEFFEEKKVVYFPK